MVSTAYLPSWCPPPRGEFAVTLPQRGRGRWGCVPGRESHSASSPSEGEDLGAPRARSLAPCLVGCLHHPAAPPPAATLPCEGEERGRRAPVVRSRGANRPHTLLPLGEGGRGGGYTRVESRGGSSTPSLRRRWCHPAAAPRPLRGGGCGADGSPGTAAGRADCDRKDDHLPVSLHDPAGERPLSARPVVVPGHDLSRSTDRPPAPGAAVTSPANLLRRLRQSICIWPSDPGTNALRLFDRSRVRVSPFSPNGADTPSAGSA